MSFFLQRTQKIAPVYMTERKLISPFVIRPDRISNYSQLVTLLKQKQEKYKGPIYSSSASPFLNVLTTEKEKFDIDAILEGYMHKKLLERFEEHVKDVKRDVLSFIDHRISQVQKEADEKFSCIKVGNIDEISDVLFRNPDWNTFRDWLLMDLWECLSRRMKPTEFLNYAFFRHVQLFMGDMSIQSTESSVRKVVTEYVKKRFNCEEYSLESYESRYLWAELFVFFRLGKILLVRELLSKYEIFFEFMSHNFKSSFLDYLEGREYAFSHPLSRNEDLFKAFFFDLLEGKSSNSPVIETAEDYIWRCLIESPSLTQKKLGEIARLGDKFEDVRVRLMAFIVCGAYKNAISTLIKNDFSVPVKFFFLREICLEQQLDCVDPRGDLSQVNPVFLNFLFSIASQIVSKEQKVRIVEMLRPYIGYHAVVPRYIVKYSLFDILGGESTSIERIEYSLDSEITKGVIEELKASGDKVKLMSLSHFISDDVMGSLLADIIEEAIMTGEKVDALEVRISRLKTRDGERAKELYGIYLFCRSGSISSLRSSVLSASDADLSSYKGVIEKVFSKAVDTVKAEKDKELAKHLFKVCGLMELSEECCLKASNDLVGLI